MNPYPQAVLSIASLTVLLLASGCVVPTISMHTTREVTITISEADSGQPVRRTPFRVSYDYEHMSPFVFHYQFRTPPELRAETDGDGKAVVRLAAYNGWIQLEVAPEQSPTTGGYYGRFQLDKHLIREGGTVECRWAVYPARGRQHPDLILRLEPMKTPPNNALEPTPVGAFSSAFAVDITGPAWLSLGR
jgi:hypothetical protein